MARDSEKTKQKLLKAAQKLLAETGFQDVGVNSIAREAGVDKVLIYRYFGGLKELLRELAVSSDFWPTAEDLIGCSIEEKDTMDIRVLTANVIKNRMRELRKRPATQEILRWELIERNELTDQLHFARENLGWELNDLLPFSTGNFGGLDVQAAATILIAGVTYLVIRSKTADTYNGIDLHSETGWERIENTVDSVLDIFFKHVIRKTDSREQ